MGLREPLFESRLLHLLLWHAQQCGVSPEPLLEKYGLPADLLLGQPGQHLLKTALSVPRRLADELSRLLGDEHLGLTLAQAVPKGSYGIAEFLIRANGSVRDAFQNLTRFSALISPDQTFRFEETDTEGREHFGHSSSAQALGRHLTEYTAAILVLTLRSMAPVRLQRMWFATPMPPTVARLESLFQIQDFEFDQPTSGFAVAKADLERPMSGADPALFRFLEELADSALASRPKADDVLGLLRQALREALELGDPSIQRACSLMNVSGRTLERRLTERHTSFQEVLDNVRFDLARGYLRDPRLEVTQVAYLLGYSEARAFDRAFRRWADSSPTEWRTQRAQA